MANHASQRASVLQTPNQSRVQDLARCSRYSGSLGSGKRLREITRMQQLSAPWPEYRTLLAVNKTKILNIGRRMRLAWGVERSKKFRSLVDEAVSRCPWVRPAMDRHPILFRPLMSRFLDPRLSSRQLFTYYAHDLEFTSTHINRAFPNFFSDHLSR